ncbi:MAG: DUF2158 domain-containing protein [Gemmataceae bacterium]
MSEVQFGALVRLHSGDTVMTVIGAGTGGVHCEWRDGAGVLRHGTFAREALVEMEPDARPGVAAGTPTAAEKFVQELLPGLQRLFE